MELERLGLGCARLGSVLGTRGAEADELVAAAFSGGIRFFDTANIYGQGESERILARALKRVRDKVIIATKAGQYFPAWVRVSQPLKNALGPILKRSRAGRGLVSRTRGGMLPQDFSDSFLRLSAEGSLKRLKVDCLDILMLHSPPGDVIKRGDALGSLERLRDAGKARMVGVSCEEVESALLALKDPRVKVIELPLWPWTELSQTFLHTAQGRDVRVLARGAMGAISVNRLATDVDRSVLIREAIRSCLAVPGVDHLIVGTSRVSHLHEILQAAEGNELK